MTEQKGKPDRTLWMLGAAITLPMILMSGPIAGFAIGQFILVRFFQWPPITVPIFVGLGFAASGMQAYQLIKRIKQFESK